MTINAQDLIPALPADLSKDAAPLAQQAMGMGMVLASAAMHFNLAEAEINRRKELEERLTSYLTRYLEEREKNAELTVEIISLKAQLRGERPSPPVDWDSVGAGISRVVGAGMGAYAVLGGYIESLRAGLEASSPADPKMGVILWTLRWLAAFKPEEKTELVALLMAQPDGLVPPEGRRRLLIASLAPLLAGVKAGASDPEAGAAAAGELVALLSELTVAAQLSPDELASSLETVAAIARNMAGG